MNEPLWDEQRKFYKAVRNSGQKWHHSLLIEETLPLIQLFLDLTVNYLLCFFYMVCHCP